MTVVGLQLGRYLSLRNARCTSASEGSRLLMIMVGRSSSMIVPTGMSWVAKTPWPLPADVLISKCGFMVELAGFLQRRGM